MSVIVSPCEDGNGRVARLQGACPVEDAEVLLATLQLPGRCVVDVSAAGSLHTAVVQALLAFRPDLSGVPEDQFLAGYVLPALDGAERA